MTIGRGRWILLVLASFGPQTSLAHTELLRLLLADEQLATYMIGFGLFYCVIGGVSTVHHQTIDATFLNPPFHHGRIYIGLMFFAGGAIFKVTHHRDRPEK
jgi:hypothetical protein